MFPFPVEIEETRFDSECGRILFDQPRTVWGFMTRSGCVVIEPQFETVEPFSKDGLAVVGVEEVIETENQWGVGVNYGAIDRQGTMRIEPEYLALSSFEDGVATGILWEQQEDWISASRVGYYVGADGARLGDAGCGVMVSRAELHKCQEISEGLVFQKPSLTLAEWKEVLPEEMFESVRADVSRFSDFTNEDSVFSSSKTPGRYTDAAGNVVIEQWFSLGCPFREGLACVKPLDGSGMGYIDPEGNAVLPFVYSSARDFEDGVARVYQDGGTAFIDRTGAKLFTTEHRVQGSFHDGRAEFYELGDSGMRYGFIDLQGEVVIPPTFSRVGEFSDGVAAVHAGRKYGRDQWRFIDAQGNAPEGLGELRFGSVTTPRFDKGLALVQEVSLSDEGTHWSMVDGQMQENPGSVVEAWGYVNREGEWVFGPEEILWNTPAGFLYTGAALCEQRREARREQQEEQEP